ncbi:hypothetical protein SUGI_0649810 [Cryptomeria japonica]|nr:hypothetical protein SUGI_0649810 [Cryptomeria japonica]
MVIFRHEMQNPASVHITNAKKKKLEVLYDLLGSSQVASLRQRVAHIANPVFEFSVFLGTTNPFGFTIKHRSHGFSIQLLIWDCARRCEANQCTNGRSHGGSDISFSLSQTHGEGSYHVLQSIHRNSET